MREFSIITNLDIYIKVASIIKNCDKFSILRISSPFLSDIPSIFLTRIPDELPKKAMEGANIQILTRPPKNAEILFLLDQWSRGGVQVKINPRIHGKIILFSKKVTQKKQLIKEEYTTLIGSANLTCAGLSVSDRANLEITLCSHKKNIFSKVQKIYTKWWLARESQNYLRWKFKFRRAKLRRNDK